MSTTTESKLVLCKEDYDLLKTYLRGGLDSSSFDRKNAEALEAELDRAKIIKKGPFPEDVVRINSKVTIRNEKQNKNMVITLVIPTQADIKSGKVSVMAPIGTALIGFRKGQTVNWKLPAGETLLTILEVENPTD
jgi:regulator of nucleoside diphosphate kinase